jgi:cell fate (sporulation/competence/biofilm development) regulator YlbF (YheA/YmcA/DUF963 family)
MVYNKDVRQRCQGGNEMTIKEATKSIEVYKRIQQLTGIDHSEEIKACENDIEEIRKSARAKKIVRNVKANKDQIAWGELLNRLNSNK